MKRRFLWTVPMIWQSVKMSSEHFAAAEKNIFEIEECPNGYYCENGSTCKVHPEKENTYYCDCSSSPKVVAGLRCEFEATTFCNHHKDDITSESEGIFITKDHPMSTRPSHFCTNNAVCIDISTAPAEYPKMGCLCSLYYEGDHCEFKIGTMSNELTYRKQQQYSTNNQKGKPSFIEIQQNIEAAEALVMASFRKGYLRKAL